LCPNGSSTIGTVAHDDIVRFAREFVAYISATTPTG